MNTSQRLNTTSPLRVLDLGDLATIERKEWTLADIIAIFRRRRKYLIASVIALFIAVTLYCLLATPRYQATGEIEVQKESPGIFGLESSVMDNSNTEADSLDYSMTLETEAGILQSGTLALEVIKDLNLETTQDYYPPHKTGIQLPAWFTFWKKPVEPMNLPLDDAPNRRYVVLKIFAAHLKVTPVPGTRLIDVSYSDPDPRRAAAVVNRLIQALTDYAFQARFNATAQASSWLGNQLVGLRKQTESLQEKAIRLQRDTGIFGQGDGHNVVLERLETLNQALIAAESNRILKQAIYHAAQSGDPELISGLAGNAASGTTPAVTNSLALIQSLRSQEAAVRSEIAADDTKYGSAYPRLAELQAQLDGIENSIRDEIHRIGERTRTDYEIAAQAEDSARQSLDKQKALANETNDKAIAYDLARQEADGSRNIYQGLLARLKQAGILEGLRSTNVTIVNPARVPPPNRPHSPNVPLYYAAALTAGLFLGCSSALIREIQDHSVRSLHDLEQALGIPLLGVIPDFRPRSWSLPHASPRARGIPVPATPVAAISSPSENCASAPFLEALRSLRTSLLTMQDGHPPKTVLITSSIAGEGKTRLTASLAAVLAQLNARVLLVDADLRCPALHSEVGLNAAAGLGSALTSDLPPEIHQHPQLPALSILCGGATPPLPSELLGSSRMSELLARWRTEYDFILLDSPPVLPVTDARILSRMCDATVLVARYGFTSRQAIQRSCQLLRQQLPAQAVMGAVLNRVSARSADYYEYYGYRSSGRAIPGSRRKWFANT